MKKNLFVLGLAVVLGFAFQSCENPDGPEIVPVPENSEAHLAVDLGLSVNWATCNVGATNPGDLGYFFAWGETGTKNGYQWKGYNFCINGNYENLTKYCFDEGWGEEDGLTTLESGDDAARANWGGNWRMPTVDEFKELIEGCTWTWTSQDGQYGYKVTNKNNSENSVFLPLTGYKEGANHSDSNLTGRYWSSSLHYMRPTAAYHLGFYEYEKTIFVSDYNRCLGLCVRPVCEKVKSPQLIIK